MGSGAQIFYNYLAIGTRLICRLSRICFWNQAAKVNCLFYIGKLFRLYLANSTQQDLKIVVKLILKPQEVSS